MRVISQSFAAVAMQHIRAFRALQRGEECAELAEIRRSFRLSETESADGGFPLPVRTVAERKSGRREAEEEEEEVEVELEASASRPGSTARALAADVLAADDSGGAKDEGTRQLGAADLDDLAAAAGSSTTVPEGDVGEAEGGEAEGGGEAGCEPSRSTAAPVLG